MFQPFLANAALSPAYGDITQASAVFQDFIRIRKSSPLFRLQTGNDVKQRLKFYNVGLGQVPGLIVYSISDQVGRQQHGPGEREDSHLLLPPARLPGASRQPLRHEGEDAIAACRRGVGPAEAGHPLNPPGVSAARRWS